MLSIITLFSSARIILPEVFNRSHDLVSDIIDFNIGEPGHAPEVTPLQILLNLLFTVGHMIKVLPL